MTKLVCHECHPCNNCELTMIALCSACRTETHVGPAHCGVPTVSCVSRPQRKESHEQEETVRTPEVRGLGKAVDDTHRGEDCEKAAFDPEDTTGCGCKG